MIITKAFNVIGDDLMKNKLIVLLCLVSVMLSGCSQSDTDNTSKNRTGNDITSNTNDITDMTFSSFEDKYNAYLNEYPDKTILVWITDEEPKYEQELNDYPYNNGYDYVVCFKNILDYANGNSYYQIVSDMINNGEQIDLIDSFGVMFGKEPISNNYYYYSEHGMFEVLDGYLTDEKYSEYFDMLPQKYWDSYKYKGHIYGIDNSFSSLYSDNGYSISNEVFDKTDFTPEDFQKSPFELAEQFKLCYQITNKNVNFNLYFFTSDFYPANYIDEGIAIVDGKAINVYATDEAAEFYSKINAMKNEGYLTIDSTFPEMSAIENISSIASFGNTVPNNFFDITKVFYQNNDYIKNPTRAIGVSKKSENKDIAFDFLMNITFNSEINNVITYGVEGVNYEINENGLVEMLTSDSGANYVSDTIYNNPMVSLPCTNTSDEIYYRDFYTEYKNADVIDGFGFLFDGAEIKDTYINVIEKIMEFNPVSEDIDAYLEDFNKELYYAGMQDVLDEINRQLEEYSEKNN